MTDQNKKTSPDRDCRRAYYLQNHEQILEYYRKYYAKNCEKNNACQRESYRKRMENPEYREKYCSITAKLSEMSTTTPNF